MRFVTAALVSLLATAPVQGSSDPLPANGTYIHGETKRDIRDLARLVVETPDSMRVMYRLNDGWTIESPYPVPEKANALMEGKDPMVVGSSYFRFVDDVPAQYSVEVRTHVAPPDTTIILSWKNYLTISFFRFEDHGLDGLGPGDGAEYEGLDALADVGLRPTETDAYSSYLDDSYDGKVERVDFGREGFSLYLALPLYERHVTRALEILRGFKGKNTVPGVPYERPE